MSPESRLSRREFLAGSIALGSSLFFSCKPETQEGEWKTVLIPNGVTQHIDVSQKDIKPIGKVKITDLYIYSNPSESWFWLAVGFDRVAGPGFERFNFYLAKYKKDIDISQKNNWLTGPKLNGDEGFDSFLNAFSNLIDAAQGKQFEEKLAQKSVILPLSKPSTEEPHILIYTKMDQPQEAINDIVPVKIVFQQTLTPPSRPA